MNRQRLFCSNLVLFISILLLTISFLGDAFAENVDSPESVHAILSGMSDEQVRQLLIEELKKDAAAKDESFSLESEIDGPGAPFARVLKSLESESVQSEHNLEYLWAGIPNFIPDLYKTFVAL